MEWGGGGGDTRAPWRGCSLGIASTHCGPLRDVELFQAVYSYSSAKRSAQRWRTEHSLRSTSRRRAVPSGVLVQIGEAKCTTWAQCPAHTEPVPTDDFSLNF